MWLNVILHLAQNDYGIVDRLVDKPREAGLISFFIGSFSGTIGVALYLSRRNSTVSYIGLALVVLGMLTPLIPWWLLFLIWWT